MEITKALGIFLLIVGIGRCLRLSLEELKLIRKVEIVRGVVKEFRDKGDCYIFRERTF
jgi:hypothetical protein